VGLAAHEVLPLEYNKTICLMKSNLKHVLQIGETSSDPKIKLEARKIANEIAKNMMTRLQVA